MKNQKSIAELQKSLKLLNEEKVLNEKTNEEEKKKFSNLIKNIDPSEIRNTIFVEKKFTLWDRIKRVLGIS
jgi:hypothetical protein